LEQPLDILTIFIWKVEKNTAFKWYQFASKITSRVSGFSLHRMSVHKRVNSSESLRNNGVIRHLRDIHGRTNPTSSLASAGFGPTEFAFLETCWGTHTSTRFVRNVEQVEPSRYHTNSATRFFLHSQGIVHSVVTSKVAASFDVTVGKGSWSSFSQFCSFYSKESKSKQTVQ
jgi:hypothetical protein